MLRSAFLSCLAMLAADWVPAAQAQVIVVPAPRPYHRPYRVETRQIQWAAAVFASPAQAQGFAQSKVAQGYQIMEQVLPTGQIQVTYRMPTWRTYAVVRHGSEAHGLARSLQSRGLEVRVVH